MSKTTPEGKVKAQVRKILDELQVYWFCPRGTAMGRSGIPDFVCCLEGAFISIETKAGKNTPTALQNIEMARIKKAGGFAFVVNEQNVGQLKNTLAQIAIMQRHCIELLQAEGAAKKDEKTVVAPEKPGLITVL